MWISILAALAVTNFLLFIIWQAGDKALIFTWLPARNIVVTTVFALSTNHVPQEFLNAAWFNFGSHVIPVLFLLVFTIGIISYNGREPRFERHGLWTIIWIIALITGGCCASGVWFFKNVMVLRIIGCVAAIFNFLNLISIPKHPSKSNLTITWTYVILTNIVVTTMMYIVFVLVENGQTEVVGILSNLPIISIALLAHSTCTSIGTDITAEHVYILAWQIWPSLTFSLMTIVTYDFGWIWMLCISIVSTIIVIIIQLTVLTKILY